jgi:hypothetical protein
MGHAEVMLRFQEGHWVGEDAYCAVRIRKDVLLQEMSLYLIAQKDEPTSAQWSTASRVVRHLKYWRHHSRGEGITITSKIAISRG